MPIQRLEICSMHWPLYNNTFWDDKDNIFETRPNVGNSYIPTNVIITPNQKRRICPDWPNDLTRCNPDKEGKDLTSCRFEKFSAAESYLNKHIAIVHEEKKKPYCKLVDCYIVFSFLIEYICSIEIMHSHSFPVN